jgi:hypothetical protein
VCKILRLVALYEAITYASPGSPAMADKFVQCTDDLHVHTKRLGKYRLRTEQCSHRKSEKFVWAEQQLSDEVMLPPQTSYVLVTVLLCKAIYADAHRNIGLPDFCKASGACAIILLDLIER